MRAGRSVTVDVAPDGAGLVSHAGAALLAEVADRVGLTRELGRALMGLRERRGKHDPGRVIRDLAVMLADGGDCLSDLRAVRDQQPLFGPVASDSTAFRLIDQIAADPQLLDAVGTARARARENAWAAGARSERIIVELDATLIGAHSEKEGAAGTFKGDSAFTRCWPTWTTAARRLRRCCGRATRAPTRPPTTSRSSTWRSSSCRATSS